MQMTSKAEQERVLGDNVGTLSDRYVQVRPNTDTEVFAGLFDHRHGGVA